jgi:hypothetical protein
VLSKVAEALEKYVGSKDSYLEEEDSQLTVVVVLLANASGAGRWTHSL